MIMKSMGDKKEKASRIEKDSLGEIKVSEDKYWGAQTQRSHENFRIGSQIMPLPVIRALALVKKAAALANAELGILPKEKKDLIVKAADEIISGKLDDHFPLVVWQTGSGTQSNMNVNEVISNWANEKAGGKRGEKTPIHPNDDVNEGQSSNDVFPTAMNIAATLLIKEELLPSLYKLYKNLDQKAKEYKDIVKVGRTHLMDAAPLTLGQEFSGYASQLKHAIDVVEHSLKSLTEIALGGTAVGTGLNTHPKFAKRVAEIISELTGVHFTTAKNLFAAIAAHDGIVEMSGALRLVAVIFLKIGNDIRLMASGPRCGIGELVLPTNEPGSSIMPGKVNPTQCEALTMVSVQVMGHDLTISLAGSMGTLELNAFKPVMIFNLLESIHLLADVSISFNDKCLVGIEPNRKRIAENLDKSLMQATALNTEIGYDKASQVVKKAYSEDISVKDAALKLGFITPKRFDEVVDPKKMVHPNIE